MKEFLNNLLVIIVTIILTTLIIVWVTCVGLLFAIPVTIESVFWKTGKIGNRFREILIMPYKLLGVCDSWNSYVNWVRFNS